MSDVCAVRERLCKQSRCHDLVMGGQGTIVDRIDFNIQNVAASVEQGVKELQQVNLLVCW